MSVVLSVLPATRLYHRNPMHTVNYYRKSVVSIAQSATRCLVINTGCNNYSQPIYLANFCTAIHVETVLVLIIELGVIAHMVSYVSTALITEKPKTTMIPSVSKAIQATISTIINAVG